MSLNKILHGSTTYFELFISCPVCFDQGKNTPHSYWEHQHCGGNLYVGDNAFYLCSDCKSTAHVFKWRYGCPNHSGAEIEYLESSPQGLAQAVSTAGQLVQETGIAWLQKFLENMGIN
jgi:hypothetical protein